MNEKKAPLSSTTFYAMTKVKLVTPFLIVKEVIRTDLVMVGGEEENDD